MLHETQESLIPSTSKGRAGTANQGQHSAQRPRAHWNEAAGGGDAEQAKSPADKVGTASSPLRKETPPSTWAGSKAKKILNEQAKTVTMRKHALRLRLNLVGLALGTWFIYTDHYRSLVHLLTSLKVPPEVIAAVRWALLVLLLCNIAEASWHIIAPREEYEYLPATSAHQESPKVRSPHKSSSREVYSTASLGSPFRLASGSPRSDIRAAIGAQGPAVARQNQSVFSPESAPRAASTPLSARYRSSKHGIDSTMTIRELDGMLDRTIGPSTTRATGQVDASATPARGPGQVSTNFVTPTPRLPVAGMTMTAMQSLSDPFAPAPTPMQQRMSGLGGLSVYHTASPGLRPAGGSDSRKAHKSHFGDYGYLDPDEVIHKFNITTELPYYIENMRRWFSKYLLAPLAKQIDETDTLLKENELGHLTCLLAMSDDPVTLLNSTNTPTPSTIATTARSLFGSSVVQQQPAAAIPSTLQDMAKDYPKSPITKLRLSLECYLSVPGFNNSNVRAYIINRIRELNRGDTLSDYTWDGGSTSQDGLHWKSSIHPSDGQLLFHLFCTFMDQCMPISEAVNRSFSKRYIIAINDKPDANLPAQIVQIVKSSRPHYCLMIKNSYHDIVAQRNNLFVALIVFILQIKEEYSGYLNMVNLGSKQINLLSVLDTDNDYGKYSGSSSSKGSVGRR